jgi:hypothetical protein
LALTTLILIGVSGSMWNYVIRSVVEEKSKLDAEIDLAQTIQKDFLPTLNIQNEVVEVYGQSEFATEVGGDYYDAFWLSDGRLIVAVGDVSGHNVAAGLLMAITKAAFRAELRHFTTLERLMHELNNDICDNSRPKMFVSFACLLLDFRSQDTHGCQCRTFAHSFSSKPALAMFAFAQTQSDCTWTSTQRYFSCRDICFCFWRQVSFV